MKINKAAIVVLDQLEAFIVQLDEQSYNQPIMKLGNSTLGQHVRHTLEFFMCLCAGVASSSINYDKRERNHEIETNPKMALNTLDNVRSFLKSDGRNSKLTLEINYADVEAVPCIIETNFERELAYNIEHAVHHMAILKIGGYELVSGLKLPEGFGVAVSTIRHQKAQV